jgi:hypothetical protein
MFVVREDGPRRQGFLAATGARLVFRSKALTASRTPPVPDSAIPFYCRLGFCMHHRFFFVLCCEWGGWGWGWQHFSKYFEENEYFFLFCGNFF